MSLLPTCEEPAGPRSTDRLSSRQLECLQLTADGLTSGEIGRRLGLSARTVDEHLLLACRALGVRTRVQAVVVLVRAGAGVTERRAFAPGRSRDPQFALRGAEPDAGASGAPAARAPDGRPDRQ